MPLLSKHNRNFSSAQKGMKAKLDHLRKTKGFVVILTVGIILGLVGPIGCIVYSGIWHSRISPWFGYVEGNTSKIQSILPQNLIYPIIAIIFIVILEFRKKKNPHYYEIYGCSLLAMTFLVFGLLSTLITILRSTDEKCSNAFAEFWAAIPGLPEKEANEFNNYWNKLTDGKAEYEVEDYKNDWFKDRCQRPHSTIEGYFIAYIICLVIIIFVYVIQYISNSNYQSLDIQYVSSDERHLLGDIEDE